MHRQELDKLRASQDDVNSELQSEREAINKLTCQINSMEEQLNKVIKDMPHGQYYECNYEGNDAAWPSH